MISTISLWCLWTGGAIKLQRRHSATGQKNVARNLRWSCYSCCELFLPVNAMSFMHRCPAFIDLQINVIEACIPLLALEMAVSRIFVNIICTLKE